MRRAVTIGPNETRSHVGLGFALQARGDFDGATESFERALAIDANDVNAHVNLAALDSQVGRIPQAIEHGRRGVAIAPNDAHAHAALGNALQASGDLDGAIAEFRAAIKISPDDVAFHKQLGAALGSADRAREAVDELGAAAALDPEDATLLVNLGKALANVERFDEALARFDAAMAAAPDSRAATEALGASGVVMLESGRFDDAQDRLTRALAVLPADHPEHAMIARQLDRCRDRIALRARLPGVLAGTDRAASGDESWRFADLCRIEHRYAAAARFAAAAFAADSSLTADPARRARSDAASFAVLAGSSRDVDGPYAAGEELDARRRWRHTARQWLRADLVEWERILDQRGPAARGAIEAVLGAWRDDANLGGIRDSAALESFDLAERAECAALWKDVELLLARAAVAR